MSGSADERAKFSPLQDWWCAACTLNAGGAAIRVAQVTPGTPVANRQLTAWANRNIRANMARLGVGGPQLSNAAFTRTAVYSGTDPMLLSLREHFPFVLPVVFATTINNMLWAIGMEVTLSVLGLSDVTVPTIGTTIFWANQHQALVAGVWWWLAAPVFVAIILFLGLYLFFSSVNEYIDPRTRLRLMGG